jgi:hypothetical protein
MQELMIMTIIFFRHYRFRVEPGFGAVPDPLITLRPKHGMRLIAETRRPLASHIEASAILSAHELT